MGSSENLKHFKCNIVVAQNGVRLEYYRHISETGAEYRELQPSQLLMESGRRQSKVSTTTELTTQEKPLTDSQLLSVAVDEIVSQFLRDRKDEGRLDLTELSMTL
jgi:hypothetical protein